MDPELEGLREILERYGFKTTKWLIPTKNAHRKLMLKVGEFVDAYDGKDCLMMLYYGGHAFINQARQSTWSWYVVYTFVSHPRYLLLME